MRFKYIGEDRILKNATVYSRNNDIKLKDGEEYDINTIEDQFKYTMVIDGKPVVSPESKLWFAFSRQNNKY